MMMMNRSESTPPRQAIRELVECLFDANADVKRTAERLGLTVCDFAELAHSEPVRELVSFLREMTDLQSDIFISSHRKDAAARLLHVALGCDSEETARRACNDFINLVRHSRAERPTSGDPEGFMRPPDDQPLEIQSLYRRLGHQILDRQEHEDDHDHPEDADADCPDRPQATARLDVPGAGD